MKKSQLIQEMRCFIKTLFDDIEDLETKLTNLEQEFKEKEKQSCISAKNIVD